MVSPVTVKRKLTLCSRTFLSFRFVTPALELSHLHECPVCVCVCVCRLGVLWLFHFLVGEARTFFQTRIYLSKGGPKHQSGCAADGDVVLVRGVPRMESFKSD
jgi:hypothetical protein